MKHNFDVWTKDEMRFYRRNAINAFFHDFKPYQRIDSLRMIKTFVRKHEVFLWGFELRAYKYYE